MSKETNEEMFPRLRTYPAPFKDELVLLCTKCMRKWKKNAGKKDRVDVRKGLKKRAKASKSDQKVRVLGVNCLKVCPKNGATVMTQRQLAHHPAQVSVIRTESDLEALYAQVMRHT